MVTLTPSSSSKARDEKKSSFTLYYLILLSLFGTFSFIQMVRSKHLHDHGESKPTLNRDEEAAALRGTKTTAEEVNKIGVNHDKHLASLQDLSAKLTKKGAEDGQDIFSNKGDEKRLTIENGIEPDNPKDLSPMKAESNSPENGLLRAEGNIPGNFAANASATDRQLKPALKPKVKEPPPPQFYAVTYATNGGRDDRFCRSLESALRHNYDLTILGWGEKWRGLSQKLEAAEAFASSIGKDDIMLFTDAYDVLFAERSEAVRMEFEGMNAPIVFSGECGCWPHAVEDHGRACFKKYPKAPTPYRYLNSGTWIGRASNVTAMLREVIKEAGSNFRMANDQKLVADFYIAGRFGIKLDFYNKIFQSMHMTLDPPLPRCDPTKDVQLTMDKRFYNQLTKSRPSIFHFNGGGKRVHLQMESAIWYKSDEYNTPAIAQKLRSTLIHTPTKQDKGQRMRFDMICPGYLKSTVSKAYYR